MMQTTPGGGGGAGGGGGVQQRELRYKVTVVADTSQARQEFGQMGQAGQQTATATQQAAGRAQQAMGYGPPPAWGYGPPGGYGPPPPPDEAKTLTAIRNPNGAGFVYADRHGNIDQRATAANAVRNAALGTKGTPQNLFYDPATGYRPVTDDKGNVPLAKANGGGGLEGMVRGAAAFGAALTFVTTALSKMREVLDVVNTSQLQSLNAREKVTGAIGVIPFVGKPIADTADTWFTLQEQFGFDKGRGYGAKSAAKGYDQKYMDAMRRKSIAETGKDNTTIFDPWLAQTFGAMDAYAEDRDYLRTLGPRMDESAARDAGRTRLDNFDDSALTQRLHVESRQREAADLRPLLVPAIGDYWVGKTGPMGRTRFDQKDEYDAPIRVASRAAASAREAKSTAFTERNWSMTDAAQAKKEVNRTGYDSAMAEAQRLDAEAKTNPSIKTEATAAYARAQEKAQEYAQQLTRYQEALNTARQKTVQLAEAEYRLGQQTLAVSQAKLDVTNSKLKGIDGYAESYALMDGAKRQGLGDAVKDLNTRGFDALSPEQREVLGGSGITGDYFRKKARESVFSNADTDKQLNQLLTDTGQQTRDELIGERKKLQAQIELQFVANADQLAAVMRTAFEKLDPELRKMIDEQVKVQVNATKLQQFQAAASK